MESQSLRPLCCPTTLVSMLLMLIFPVIRRGSGTWNVMFSASYWPPETESTIATLRPERGPVVIGFTSP